MSATTMLSFIRRLFRRDWSASQSPSDCDIFIRGLNTPFDSPMGIVHEVYSVQPCGHWGIVPMLGSEPDANTQTTNGTMYTVRAEVEVLEQESIDDAFAHAAGPTAFQRANPHRATKRVVMDVWMTEDELLKHAIE